MQSQSNPTNGTGPLEKAFTIRRSILKLTGNQWNILNALNLASITPRQWIEALGTRGGFMMRQANEEEREFRRIVHREQSNLPRCMTIQPDEPQSNATAEGTDWKNKLIRSLESALNAAKQNKARDALAWTVNAEGEARKWFKQTIGS